MSQRTHSTCEIYCADFETCDYGEGVRVWSWAIASKGEVVGYGESIRGFLAFVSRHFGVYYFHNLKFDGNFIVSYLLINGWEWVNGTPRDKQFSTLISDDGAWYSIKLRLNGMTQEIRDSLKKIPLPVSDIPKAFGFEAELTKGSIDYTAVRSPGYVPTKAEWEYVFNDVKIVSRAMQFLTNSGMDSLTQSSDAFNEYKNGVEYRRYFPALSNDVDAFVRSSYRGGFTYADPRYANTVHDVSGIVVDANSMYPSVMMYRPMPYGHPTYVEEMPDAGLWIGRIYLDIEVKERHIPCISKGRHLRYGTAADYVNHIDEELTITSVDWELIKQQYNINNAVFIDGYHFKSSDSLFSTYINKWYAVKREARGGRRWIAKMMLNKLYGKFGMRTEVASKRPYLGPDQIVKYQRLPYEDKDGEYVPVATFVTAWARYTMVSAAQENYDTFAYCDTDSMHLLGREVKGVVVDNNDLGCWKVEGEFTKACYKRAKCYIETIDGRDVVHIAGLPAKLNNSVTYDLMLTGGTISGKLVPKVVKGGVRLVETTFTIK